MLNNKRAQIGETMTWVVATIIILVILAIAIYAASIMSLATRTINVGADESSVLLKKSLYGYLLTQEIIEGEGESVFVKLSKGSIDTFSKDLGDKVFVDPTDFLEFSLGLDEEVISGKAYEEIKLKEDTTLEVRISFKGI